MKNQNPTPKTTLKQNKHQHIKGLKSLTRKIIQWNCHGNKANYNDLRQLLAELNPTCLQEIFKKMTK